MCSSLRKCGSRVPPPLQKSAVVANPHTAAHSCVRVCSVDVSCTASHELWCIVRVVVESLQRRCPLMWTPLPRAPHDLLRMVAARRQAAHAPEATALCLAKCPLRLRRGRAARLRRRSRWMVSGSASVVVFCRGVPSVLCSHIKRAILQVLRALQLDRGSLWAQQPAQGLRQAAGRPLTRASRWVQASLLCAQSKCPPAAGPPRMVTAAAGLMNRFPLSW